MHKNVGRVLATIAALAAVSTSVIGDDDFPIIGTYTRDQVCRGDGSDRADLVVKITHEEIQFNMGSCAILSKRRDGRTISMQVQCKMSDEQIILGDVKFTQRDDKALDFDDQDHTSPAVLHRCGK